MRRLFQKLVLHLFDAAAMLLLLFSLLVVLVVFRGSALAFTHLLQRFTPFEKEAQWIATLLSVGVAALWHMKVSPRLLKLAAASVDKLQGAFAESQGLMGPNPSAGWTADPGVLLVFDLGRHTFCDVSPGQPLEKLAFLGCCDLPRWLPGELLYEARCLSVWYEEDRLDGVILFFQRNDEPCRGVDATFRRAGRTLALTADSTEQEVLECLGPPTRRDDDGELIYEFPTEAAEWRVNIGKNGKLETFELWRPRAFANRPASSLGASDEEPLKSSSA